MRSSDCGAPGRGTTLTRGGVGRRASVAHPRPRSSRSSRRRPSAAIRSTSSCSQSPADDQRRVRRPQRRRGETRARRRRVIAASERSLPSGVCPYGCVAVEQLHERAIGDRAGMSRSCVRRCSRSCRTRSKSASVSAGRATMSASSRTTAAGEAARGGDRQHAPRPEPMSESSCAPIARQRLVHLDRRAAAAALVEHVDGQRGKPFLARRIVGRAAPQQQQRRVTTGIAGWRDGPDAQPASAASTSRSAGKTNGRVGPGSGSRERTGLCASPLI